MIEKFFWNIYVDLKSMNRLDADFYKKYYQYRYFCRSRENAGDKSYRKSPQFIKMLDELNYSFEKISNCAGKEKDSNGEYDYPHVAYKSRIITKEGKKVKAIYACIADTTANKKIPITDIFDFLPLFSVGTMKVTNSEEDKIDCVTVESTVLEVVECFKKYLPVMGEFCNVDTCSKLVSSLCVFPGDSISEINFNSLISKSEIDTCVNGFMEMVKTKEEV